MLFLKIKSGSEGNVTRLNFVPRLLQAADLSGYGMENMSEELEDLNKEELWDIMTKPYGPRDHHCGNCQHNCIPASKNPCAWCNVHHYAEAGRDNWVWNGIK